MESRKLSLTALKGLFAVCRLRNGEPVPGWALQAPFCSVTRTPEELSIVCPEDAPPEGVRCERGWRCLKVEGPIDFALTGVVASLVVPLAGASIPVFVLSTFDTDYLMVKAAGYADAVSALRAAGHDAAGD